MFGRTSILVTLVVALALVISTASAQQYVVGKNLGIGFVDEITGYNTRDGNVFVQHLATDHLQVTQTDVLVSGVRVTSNLLANHVVNTPMRASFNGGSVSVDTVSSANIVSNDENVNIESRGLAELRGQRFVEMTADDVYIDSVDMEIFSATDLSFAANDEVRLFADRDITFRSQSPNGDFYINSPATATVSGSTGNLRSTANSEFVAQKGSIAVQAGGEFAIHSVGSVNITAKSGVQFKTLLEDIVIASERGSTSLSGTNAVLRGLDGVRVSSDTTFNITSANDLLIDADAVLLESGTAQLKISNTDNDFPVQFSSKGYLRSSSGSLAVRGNNVQLTAADAVSFTGKGSLNFVYKQDISLGSTTTPDVSIAGSALSFSSSAELDITSSAGNVFFALTDATQAGDITFYTTKAADKVTFTAADDLTTDVKFTLAITAPIVTVNPANNLLLSSENDIVVGAGGLLSLQGSSTSKATALTSADLKSDGLLHVKATSNAATLSLASGGDIRGTATTSLTFDTPQLTGTFGGVSSIASAASTLTVTSETLKLSSAQDTYINSAGTASLNAATLKVIAGGDQTHKADTTINVSATTSAVLDATTGDMLIDAGSSSFSSRSTQDTVISVGKNWNTFTTGAFELLSTTNQLTFTNTNGPVTFKSDSSSGSITSTGAATITSATTISGSGEVAFVAGGALSVDSKSTMDFLADTKQADLNDQMVFSGANSATFTATANEYLTGGAVSIKASTTIFTTADTNTDITTADELRLKSTGAQTFASTNNAVTVRGSDPFDSNVEISSGSKLQITSANKAVFFGADHTVLRSGKDLTFSFSDGNKWEAPLGTVAFDVVGTAKWTAGNGVQFTGTDLVSFTSRTSIDASSDSTNTNAAIALSTSILTAYGRSAVTVKTTNTGADIVSNSNVDYTKLVGRVTSIDSTATNVAVTAPTVVYTGTDVLTTTATKQFTATVTNLAKVTGGTASLTSAGVFSLTAVNGALTLRNSPLQLGNENDHDVQIDINGNTIGTAANRLKFFSTGIDENQDLAVLIGTAGKLSVISNGNIDVRANNEVSLAAAVDITLSANVRHQYTLANGAFVFETHGALPGATGTDSVLLATSPSGTAAVGGISLLATNAEAYVIAGSGLRYTAGGNNPISFLGTTGMYVHSGSTTSFVTSAGPTSIIASTGINLESGTATSISNGQFAAPAGPASFTAAQQLRVHSLSRITDPSKVGVSFTTGNAQAKTTLTTDAAESFFADGSFTLQAGGNLKLVASTDVRLTAENERFSFNNLGGSLLLKATIGGVSLGAGGQAGTATVIAKGALTATTSASAELQAHEDLTVLSRTGKLAVASASDLQLNVLSPVSSLDISSGGSVLFSVPASTTPTGITVEGRSVRTRAYTFTGLSSFVTIGTANTLLNPRVEIRSLAFEVDSVGGVVLNTDNSDVSLSSDLAGSLSATNFVRLQTNQRAQLTAPSVTLSATGTNARAAFTAQLATAIDGNSVQINSAEDIQALATNNVAGNDITVNSKYGTRFQATNAVQFTTSDLADLESYTSVVQAGVLSVSTQRNLLLNADKLASLTASSGTLSLATDNRNGAKLELTTFNQRSDIRLNSANSVLASSVSELNVGARSVDLSASGAFSLQSARGDVLLQASDLVQWRSRKNTVTVKALNDNLDINTTEQLSSLEFVSRQDITVSANEEIHIETQGGHGGEITFLSSADTIVRADSIVSIDSDGDLALRSRSGDVLLNALGRDFQSITDGYLDVAADRAITATSSFEMDVFADLAAVNIVAANAFTASSSGSTTFAATNGFSWTTIGNTTNQNYLLVQAPLLTVSADNGANIAHNFRGGLKSTFGAQSYLHAVKAISLTSTAVGGDIGFNAQAQSSFTAKSSLSVLAGDNNAKTLDYDHGIISITAPTTTITTTGSLSDLRMSSTAQTLISGRTSVSASSVGSTSVHSTGSIDIESNENGIRLITNLGDIVMRTDNREQGHILLLANRGLINIAAPDATILNLDEGIEVVASRSIEITNTGSQGGATGISFQAVDDIVFRTYEDDIKLEGQNIHWGLFSPGQMSFTALGGDPADRFTISSLNSITSNSRTATIRTSDDGDVTLSTRCPTTAQCPINVQSQTEIDLRSNRDVTITSAQVTINAPAANSRVRISAPNGRVVLDTIRNGEGNNAVRFAGDLLIPDHGIILPNSACSVEQSLVLSQDWLSGQVGFCVCERAVWYCSHQSS